MIVYKVLVSMATVQVGIEVMVERVGSLDPYSRSVLAPLGILFPFPLFCSKLDSYLRGEQDVADAIRANGGGGV